MILITLEVLILVTSCSIYRNLGKLLWFYWSQKFSSGPFFRTSHVVTIPPLIKSPFRVAWGKERRSHLHGDGGGRKD